MAAMYDAAGRCVVVSHRWCHVYNAKKVFLFFFFLFHFATARRMVLLLAVCSWRNAVLYIATYRYSLDEEPTIQKERG